MLKELSFIRRIGGETNVVIRSADAASSNVVEDIVVGTGSAVVVPIDGFPLVVSWRKSSIDNTWRYSAALGYGTSCAVHLGESILLDVGSCNYVLNSAGGISDISALPIIAREASDIEMMNKVRDRFVGNIDVRSSRRAAEIDDGRGGILHMRYGWALYHSESDTTFYVVDWFNSIGTAKDKVIADILEAGKRLNRLVDADTE